MAAGYNPYESPSANQYEMPPMPAGGGSTLTQVMVEHLRESRPWIRLLSILCFIGGGFMLLAAVSAFFLGLVGAMASRSAAGAAAPLLGVAYVPMSALYLVPGFMMHRFANAIDTFTTNVGSSAMEDVLDKSRAFWKTMGILALVMIGLTIVLMVGAFVFGMAAALMK